MKIEFYPFTIDSYDAVFALWQQCESIGLSDADSQERIRMYLNRNPGMSFIAASEDNVVGAILAGHDGRRWYIHHLAVASDFRKKGIARQLVNRCLKALTDSGIRKCHIFIFNSNVDGIAFWKAIGWTYRLDIGVMSKTLVPGIRGACWHPILI